MKRFLIVVDMQKDFVDGALGSNEAAAIVTHVVDKIRTFDGDIIVTYDTHTEDYMSTNEGSHLPVPHCIKDSDGWQLDAQVATALAGRDYRTVEKPTFGSIALPDVIRDMANGEPFTVELIGLCTDICVVSNALLIKANFPESEIYVDAACCAGISPETHAAALSTMACCQIQIKHA
jgi:nicotinamidase-related amidase